MKQILFVLFIFILLVLSPNITGNNAIAGQMSLLGAGVQASGGGGGGTAPTLDGQAIAGAGGSGGFSGNASATVTLTTTSTNDLIVVCTGAEVGGTPHATVSSVTATGLTFIQRSSLYIDNVTGSQGATWNTMECWSATATTVQTAKVITVALSKTVDIGMISAFGVKIDGTNVPTWTSNSPVTATSTSGTTAPTVGSVASNKAALLIGFTGSADSPDQTIGSGFTLINTGNNPAGSAWWSQGTEYKSFSSATSGQTVNFGTSYQTWGIIADAIEGL